MGVRHWSAVEGHVSLLFVAVLPSQSCCELELSIGPPTCYKRCQLAILLRPLYSPSTTRGCLLTTPPVKNMDFAATSDKEKQVSDILSSRRWCTAGNELMSLSLPSREGAQNQAVCYLSSPTDSLSDSGLVEVSSPSISRPLTMHRDAIIGSHNNELDERCGFPDGSLPAPSINIDPMSRKVVHRTSSTDVHLSCAGSGPDAAVRGNPYHRKALGTGPIRAGHVSPSRALQIPSVTSLAVETQVAKDVDGNVSGGIVDHGNPNGKPTKVIQDDVIDPRPFKFTHFELSQMIETKSVEELGRLGGAEALLNGLGTSMDHGLISKTLECQKDREGDGVAGRGHERLETSADCDPVIPVITITPPPDSDSQCQARPEVWDAEAAYGASLATRREVYGDNVLPSRRSKSFLQLVTAALKDKILVGRFLHQTLLPYVHIYP